MIKVNKIEKDWLDRLRENGFTTDSVFDKGQYEGLKRILLGVGGEAVVLPRVEPDYAKILATGQVLLGDKAKLKIGHAGKCHSNVAKNCWEYGWNIFTGYALSKDGVWRQHSWNFGSIGSFSGLIETTEKRVLYYGYPLDATESKDFVESNIVGAL